MRVQNVFSVAVLSLTAVLAIAYFNTKANKDLTGTEVVHDPSSTPQDPERLAENLSRQLPNATIAYMREGISIASETSSLPSRALPAEPKTDQTKLISFQDGRLSVQVDSRRLEEVLDEISRKSGVSIVDTEGVGGELVSIQFRDLPIEQGLQRILKDFEVFILYGKAGRVTPVKAVWVYPTGQGSQFAPARPQKQASTQPRHTSVCPEQVRNVQVVGTSADREEQQPLDTLLKTLSDSNEEVRYQAFEKALLNGLVVPEDTLQGLLQGDSSDSVRSLALHALTQAPMATREGIRSVVEFALIDPSESVRVRAQEILERIDELEQMDFASSQSDAGQ